MLLCLVHRQTTALDPVFETGAVTTNTNVLHTINVAKGVLLKARGAIRR